MPSSLLSLFNSMQEQQSVLGELFGDDEPTTPYVPPPQNASVYAQGGNRQQYRQPPKDETDYGPLGNLQQGYVDWQTPHTLYNWMNEQSNQNWQNSPWAIPDTMTGVPAGGSLGWQSPTSTQPLTGTPAYNDLVTQQAIQGQNAANQNHPQIDGVPPSGSLWWQSPEPPDEYDFTGMVVGVHPEPSQLPTNFNQLLLTETDAYAQLMGLENAYNTQQAVLQNNGNEISTMPMLPRDDEEYGEQGGLGDAQATLRGEVQGHTVSWLDDLRYMNREGAVPDPNDPKAYAAWVNGLITMYNDLYEFEDRNVPPGSFYNDENDYPWFRPGDDEETTTTTDDTGGWLDETPIYYGGGGGSRKTASWVANMIKWSI